MIELRVDGESRRIEPEALVVAGYTGADEAAVQHHIDELAAEGVAPPPRVPMYWVMPPTALTQASTIQVPSRATSGEIELALVIDRTDIYLAAASDHTCREAEATDIRLSKLICPTPISTEAMHWSTVVDHWADLAMTASVEIDGVEETYQSADAGGNRPPADLLAGIPWAGHRPDRFVLLCGTVPAIGGIRPADRFTGTITDTVTGHTIGLDYRIEPGPALRF